MTLANAVWGADHAMTEATEYQSGASGRDLGCSLRRGLVVGTSKRLSRQEASGFGKYLAQQSGALRSEFAGVLRELGHEVLVQHEVAAVPDGQVFSADKIIVRFPDIFARIGGQEVQFGASSTVCQGDLHSKIWVRASSRDGNEDIAAVVRKFSDRLYEFYGDRYNSHFAIMPAVQLEILHRFNISSSDIDDPEFVDVYNDLMRTGTMSRSIEAQKFATASEVARIMGLEKELDESAEAFAEAWAKWMKKAETRILVPETDTYRGIYAMKIDSAKQETTCTGISASFAGVSHPGRAVKGQPFSHFTSAKVASVLASDL